MGSHTSLADSLVNGTQPAKSSNFTALQQHIDDLTKEKFELVRGLQVSSVFIYAYLPPVQGIRIPTSCSVHDGLCMTGNLSAGCHVLFQEVVQHSPA